MKSRGPELVGWKKSLREQSILFTAEPVILGSGNGVTYQLKEPMVSRRHAELTLHSDGTCSVKDLDSLNGTRLNKEKLRSEREYRLTHGDSVFFGDQWFRFDNGRGLFTNSMLAWRGIAVVVVALALLCCLKYSLKMTSSSDSPQKSAEENMNE